MPLQDNFDDGIPRVMLYLFDQFDQLDSEFVLDNVFKNLPKILRFMIFSCFKHDLQHASDRYICHLWPEKTQISYIVITWLTMCDREAHEACYIYRCAIIVFLRLIYVYHIQEYYKISISKCRVDLLEWLFYDLWARSAQSKYFIAILSQLLYFID